MASVWRVNCPTHKVELTSNENIPISMDGIIESCPLFYCKECNKYYIHTDAMAFGNIFDYNRAEVVNISAIPNEVFSKAEVICESVSKLKSYVNPFVPEVCYKDKEKLEYIAKGIFKYDVNTEYIKGYYCNKCHDFYIDEELYDDIMMKYGVENNKEPSEQKIEFYGTGYNQTNKKRYTFNDIKSGENRKKTFEVEDNLVSFEKCNQNYKKDYPFSLLHYAFVFRRFDVVNMILHELKDDEIIEALHFNGVEGYEWITPLVCAKWNLNYIYAYDDKNGTNISEIIAPFLDEVEHVDEVIEYTSEVDKDGKTVFDIFWHKQQPMLDVVFYEKQTLASRQVEKNHCSIVMDEVGTGKTVSALYTIRNIIKKKINNNEKAKILVVCPYNKREDWQNDIRRQLGRYAHVVEQSDNGIIYTDKLKKVFFKEKEHIIMISGQKQGEDKDKSSSALKGSIESYSSEESWDLVIIDEAHISFDNYGGLSAKNVMLLTATPIVVNAKGKRMFLDYVDLSGRILGKEGVGLIDPIKTSVPNENDIYVNWFREDMGKKSAERKIRFVSCKRWKERENIFYKIKEKKGMLAALQYDQDDDYLYKKAIEESSLGNICPPQKNCKMEKLLSLLHENRRSYIIFCEHTEVVDNIFQMLKDEFKDSVVAKKLGKQEAQYGLEDVQEGQLINTLVQALRNNKRVLFVTTGKTGGTGLNLGEFDGVVHYELPFTSIELEQRFGRVDRIDTISKKNSRDMIFMLNECKLDENDMEINRMLYYCTTKIDITCKYMPIRNTVLYYPEFIKRNGKAIKESLEYFQKEYILSEENENNMNEIRRRIRNFEKEIKENPLWEYIENMGKNIRLSAVEALSRARIEQISEDYYDLLSRYLAYWQDKKRERNDYQRMYRMFFEAKKNAKNWLAIIGMIKVDEDNDIFVGHEACEDGDEQRIVSKKKEEKIKKKRMSVQEQISEMLELIDKCVFDDEELKSFSSEGIFCYSNGMIKRASVQKYRTGKAWN